MLTVVLYFTVLIPFVKVSESCSDANARFICPRQNEQRNFTFCCANPTNASINVSSTSKRLNLPQGQTSIIQYCCDNRTQSIYYRNESEIIIEETEKSNKIPFSQILVAVYLVLVAVVFICDFMSHIKLKKKEKSDPPSRAAESILLEKYT